MRIRSSLFGWCFIVFFESRSSLKPVLLEIRVSRSSIWRVANLYFDSQCKYDVFAIVKLKPNCSFLAVTLNK